MSPTRLGTARTSECMSGTSTMEVSSTTRSPQARVFYSFLLNRPVAGSISSRRWIVFASKPVVSVSRFAARPVGAHSRHFTPLALRIIRIEFTSVVFPTPGPPVDNYDPVSESGFQRLALAGGERLARPPLAPCDRLFEID